jgi:Ca2+-binding RTX toxin-like protein
MAILNGGNGNDILDAINTDVTGGDTLNGENGNDRLNGSVGIDTLNGGRGDDTVVGGKGTDNAFLGAGNDTFVWNPGDGNDTVDGGNGFDTLDFRGANIAETIDISANHNPDGSVSGAQFIRPNPPGTIDLTDVERIQFEAQGVNADTITINDLTGTGVKQVAIDVGAGADNITIKDVTGTDLKQVTIDLGKDDQAADTVNINSTNGDVMATETNGVVTVSGLASELTISNFGAGDQLLLNNQPLPITVIAASNNNTGGTSTESDGSHATGLALLGQAMASSFATTGDSHGATPIQDQPSSHQPSLTHPHA